MRSFRILAVIFAAAAVTPAAAAPARVEPTVSPAPRAGAAAIRERAGGKVRDFYKARGFWPLWAANGRIGSEASRLIAFIEEAHLDGLRPSSYDPDALRSAVEDAASADPFAVARAELALSRAFAAYVADTRRPTDVKMTYLDAALKPRKARADEVLRAAAAPKSFGDYIATMGWMSPHYSRLRKLLARAEEMGEPDADIDRIRLNLDRARILPGAWTHHIVVDAASARLWYYEGGAVGGTMKVIVGTPATPTPMLAGMVRYAILNPYWNVPVDLARTSVAPKVLAGRSLKAMRFEALSDWSANAKPLTPASIDWSAVASGDRELRVRQLPGGANAMGRVKFMFPNEAGIYLHDTPDRALFAKTARHFSNGCVRLENAGGLGRWLLGKPIPATFKTPEQDVAVPVPVPVYLTYFTVVPTARGVGFLPDVYGRDG